MRSPGRVARVGPVNDIHMLAKATRCVTKVTPPAVGVFRAPLASRARRLATVPHTATQQGDTSTSSSASEDTRPWVVRNPLTTAFFTFLGAWAYTLWVQNRTRKLQDSIEEHARARYPINEDEMLELRADNDAPTSAIVVLPTATKARTDQRVSPVDHLLPHLRRTIAAGQPLKHEYALERMLMAMPAVPGGLIDVRVASATLTHLSTGPVAEQLEAMFDMLASDGSSDPHVPREQLVELLRALIATGQIPPEKLVCTMDEGRNMLGIQHAWYRIPEVREFRAEELCEPFLNDRANEPSKACEPGGENVQVNGKSSVDLSKFCEMLVSERVCVWGECHRIAERKRQQKLREEAELDRLNPPFYRRWWNALRGQPRAEDE